jgi:uncharacterized protein YgiM (DUF1202 family)
MIDDHDQKNYAGTARDAFGGTGAGVRRGVGAPQQPCLRRDRLRLAGAILATGSPDPAIPADNFSARWTLTTNFAAGLYRFRLGSDDGSRLYIDNIIIIDRSTGFPNGFGEATADVNLGAGLHALRVEFIERQGNAGVIFDWTGTNVTTGPTATSNGLVTATFSASQIATNSPLYGRPLCEVIIDFANIRPDPSTNNPPIGQARLGQRFTMIGKDHSGTWFQVALADGRTGWLARRVVYLFPGSTDKLKITGSAAPAQGGGSVPFGVATGTAAANIILRDRASSRQGEKVGVVNKGENFEVIAWSRINRAWVQIRLSNGQTGWVSLLYITITSGSLNRLPRYD